MSELDKLVDRLVQLDEVLLTLKEKKKEVDNEIKEREEELIEYCEKNKKDVEIVTNGRYNVKPVSGRRLKKN